MGDALFDRGFYHRANTMRRLRPGLTPYPVDIDGRPGLVLQDELGLLDEPVVLAEAGAQILSLILATPSTDHAAAVLAAAGEADRAGAVALIERAISEFDRLGLFDGPAFEAAFRAARIAFAERSERQAACAGTCYPANSAELQMHLDDMLGPAGGPPEPAAAGLCGLIAPHLDLRCAGLGYRAAYRGLRGRSWERVIVLGVGHAMTEGRLCLTHKDFVTPLGRVPADRTAVEDLKTAAGDLVAPDDFAHRREHSIEFQLLMIQHLLGQPSPALVPILVGSFADQLDSVDRPRDIPGLRPFLEALADLWAQPDTLLICGVDFSHVGPKFGHRRTGRDLEAEVRRHEETLREALIGGDAHRYWAELGRVHDRYHVCGMSVLACLVEILDGRRVTWRHHAMWHEEATESAVSYGAAWIA